MNKFTIAWILMIMLLTSCKSVKTTSAQDVLEIKIDGITTKVYPDKKKTGLVFRYQPAELWIERYKEGEKSRLAFSVETQTSDSIAVNLLINPRYSSDYEDKIKKKLVDLLKVTPDPFQPLKTYEHITLEPMGYKDMELNLNELFRTASLHSGASSQGFRTDFSKPFPIKFMLDNADAEVLVQSLTTQRMKRIARATYGEHKHIPIFLSLEFSPFDQPLDYRIDNIDGKSVMTFSNPTEHTIKLEQILYFSANRKLKTKTVNLSFPPSVEENGPVNEREITFNDEIYVIEDIKWSPDYEYKEALQRYFVNRIPNGTTELVVELNVEKHARTKQFLSQFEVLDMEIELKDKNGGSNERKIHIDLTKGVQKEELSFSSPGGADYLKYRLVGKRKSDSTLFISEWKEYTKSKLGNEIWIDFRFDMRELMDTGQKSQKQKNLIIDHTMIIPHKPDFSDITFVPGKLTVVKTKAGAKKYYINQIGSQAKGYLELFCPIYPNTIIEARNKWKVKQHNIAKLRRAKVSLDFYGYKPMIDQEVTIDPRSHILCHFPVDVSQMDNVRRAAEKDSILVSAILHWDVGGELFATNTSGYPLVDNQN